MNNQILIILLVLFGAFLLYSTAKSFGLYEGLVSGDNPTATQVSVAEVYTF